MNKLTTYISVLCTMVSICLPAQQTPAPVQPGSILITGATAHIGNGEVIENSAIGFENGKITFVGKASDTGTTNFSKTINATGKHVYPGFIALNTSLGIGEIDAVRASDDDSEIGGIIPHVRTLIAYNAESKIVETMRPNGVLMGQIVPRGNLISGTSSVVQFDAWNWEDAVVKPDDAIHMNWPDSYKRGRWWLGEDPALKPNKEYSGQVDKLTSFMQQAKIYNVDAAEVKNLAFEAVKGLFDGSKKLFINAKYAKEITDAVNFANNAGIKNVVLVNANEAYKVTGLLLDKNIPVVIERPHSLPDNEDEDVKMSFKLAKMLADKGIMVSLSNQGDMERMSTRNLPFYAGTCAAYGLEKEKAVQLITANAAKILGIDDIAGTLENGKDATLFISQGDALDMRTNILSHAFIKGREVSLDTHQTQLWHRYSNKYKNQ
ncbi:amidohydrolase family protein [Abyssalbus ytuae]|uniref:Amidohydrolase family protein n=1 Tax=Abyssalbus ytuae TaxID=2926907 RepID=A0A9E7D2H5_9FLAO|nr:amidohydrolase family protein [Abyssalbus ytuae]UOB18173.1 amidohydrolase family protein [Abyssalbus ytuae]